jgi:hypothetical protein
MAMTYRQLLVYGNAAEQTSELDEHHDDGAYDVDDQPYADDEHQDEATPHITHTPEAGFFWGGAERWVP